MTDPDRTALIVGGGIGGLTAALCLADQGWRVRLFEQAAQFTAVGAGIQLSPNCVRVLHHLGLEAALRAVAFLPQGVEMRGWRNGATLSANRLGEAVEQRYGFPYYHVHRADLLAVLVAAAQASPHIQLRTGTRVNAIDAAQARLTIGADGEQIAGDVLIGADGIRSVVRDELFGAAAPDFTGCVAWRALVPAERMPPGVVHPVASVWLGPGKHFVHYYVRSGTLVNCVCVVEKTGWEIESWTERGEHAELARDFRGWHPTVAALIDNMERDACFKWALFDREPMPVWSRGLATLLGDACHPTLPFMAQGAAMAIEDGAVLAACLARADDVAQALVRYESLRRARTAGIQRGSRRNARVFHLRAPWSWARNVGLRRARAGMTEGLYSYDALRAGAAAPSVPDAAIASAPP